MQQAALVEQLFFEAVERHSPGEQARFLDQACGANRRVRDRVQSLVAAHARLGNYLEQQPPAITGDELVAGLAELVKETRRRLTNSIAGDEGALPQVAAQVLGPPRRSGDAGSLGPYDVERLIGIGGMGMVFLAHDSRLNRPVALKAMHPALAADSISRLRFIREAMANAAVSHDHVVSIHAVEVGAPVPYLVMEYVAGSSLRDRLADKPLAAAEIARVGSEVAQALAAAHARGLVHRDVKPANILIESSRQRVKLTDFGLARAASGLHLTDTGQVAGTPHYMSPEQARGQPVDARSDLFSLGSVLYALAAGRPPFEAETSLAVLRQVIDDRPTPLRKLRPDLPAGLLELIGDLMAKDLCQRPASAALVADLLGRLALDPSGKLPMHRRTWRRVRYAVAALAVVFIGAFAGVIWLAASRSERTPNAANAAAAPNGLANTAASPSLTAPARPVANVGPLLEFFGESKRIKSGQRLTALAVAPDSSALFVGRADGVIEGRGRDWKLQPLQIESLQRPTSMAISPRGDRLATVSSDRLLVVWDLGTRQSLSQIQTAPHLWKVEFTSDGERLVVIPHNSPAAVEAIPITPGVHFDPDCLIIVDGATLQQIHKLRPSPPERFSALACSPRGDLIAGGTRAGRILLFTAEGAPAGELSLPPAPPLPKMPGISREQLSHDVPIHDLQFSSDGQRLWSCRNDNVVACHDIASGEIRYQRVFKSLVIGLSLTRDESWLALAGIGGVRLVDRTGQLGSGGIVVFDNEREGVSFVHVLADDLHVVSASYHQGIVRLWTLPARPRDP